MPENEGDRRRGSGASGLPGGWRVIWLAKGEKAREEAAAAGALRLELSAVAEHGDAVSTVFWRHGIKPWGRGFPLGEAVIALPELPALDEVWALAMCARRERGDELPAAWEAMCRYAADVRQGLFPDRVPPEHAVQSVYLAMAQETLLGVKPDRDRFLEEALALCDHIGRRLEEGARLLDDDLLGSVPALQRYISLLAADRDLYREDRSRGRRFWAEIPAAHSPTRTARRLPLLVLEQPVARQFKLWARRDAEAPGGAGYPLLLTKLLNDAVVLSADPGQRVTVGWLAAGLTELEKSARGGGDEKKAAWYDGRNHNGTLCAAPLDGTKLSMDAVLRHFKGELRLRPIANEGKRRTALMAGAALAVALLGGGAVALAVRGGGDNRTAQAGAPRGADRIEEESAPSTDLPRGAKGEPLAKDEVINLIGSDDGPKAMKHFAVIAGVCSYEGEQKLYAPCRDARAMRDLLMRDYGYKREDIVFLVDKAEGGERVDGPPTAEVMKTQVERFRSKHGDDENSTFLFYYSGHGGYVKGAQADFGVLQPSGFFTTLKDQPYQHRGWDMQRLIDDIKKGVPSRHIMLILDACYSGWAGAKGDDDLDERVRSLWKERAEVVLSAGSKGQRAWEDEIEEKAWVWGGHSVMTAFVLEGLKKGSDGFAGADKNKDRIVTDEELAAFVKERVPGSVKQFKKATQTPAMFRLDQGYVKSGQFLFVPHDGEPPK
jgi:hypothetical protein